MKPNDLRALARNIYINLALSRPPNQEVKAKIKTNIDQLLTQATTGACPVQIFTQVNHKRIDSIKTLAELGTFNYKANTSGPTSAPPAF